MELTKLNSEYNSINLNIKNEKKKYKSTEKSISDNKAMIENKEKSLNEMKAAVEKIKSEFSQAEACYKKANQELEALSCGFVIDGDSNQVQTVQDQFLSVKNKLSEHQTAIKKAQIK